MKFFALSRTDGGVEIMQVVDGFTFDQCFAKWTAARRAEIASHREMTQTEFDAYKNMNSTLRAGIPAGGLRGAYVDRNGTLECDMTKARQICRDRGRTATEVNAATTPAQLAALLRR